MDIVLVSHQTKNDLLHLPKDWPIPKKDNLCYFKTSHSCTGKVFQVINIDFYYEKQRIEIRVTKV